MDVGWDGVALIWISFLWPLLAAVIVHLYRRASIVKKSQYWLMSIMGSYGALVIAQMAVVVASIPIKLLSNAAIVNTLGMSILFVLCIGVPILLSIWVARKCS